MSSELDCPEWKLVVFRKWKHDGSIIALFPEIPADIYGHLCMCYEHIGQHCAADYQHVIRRTVKPTQAEYNKLYQELDDETLQVVHRVSAEVHDARMDAAMERLDTLRSCKDKELAAAIMRGHGALYRRIT